VLNVVVAPGVGLAPAEAVDDCKLVEVAEDEDEADVEDVATSSGVVDASVSVEELLAAAVVTELVVLVVVVELAVVVVVVELIVVVVVVEPECSSEELVTGVVDDGTPAAVMLDDGVYAAVVVLTELPFSDRGSVSVVLLESSGPW